MTCVAEQNETLWQIRKWIKGLYKNIPLSRRDNLAKISELFEKGAWEILSPDGLTQETCEKMMAMLRRQERESKAWILGGHEDAEDGGENLANYLNYYEGLKRIHDKMELLVPEDVNEGQKPCCLPFCSPEDPEC